MDSIVQTSYKNSKIAIDLNGGLLLSWKIKGEEIFYQGSSTRRSGVPILFPFANPLEGGIFNISGLPIGQHGFGRDSIWKLKEISEASISINLMNQDISPEMQAAYPFQFEVTIKVEINHADMLKYTMEVKNLGDKSLPIAPGLHPYFPIQHELKQDLKILSPAQTSADSKLSEIQEDILFDGNNINWEQPSNGFFNNFDKEATIIFPDKQIKITECSEKSEFEHLVIWSQNEQEKDYNFVCVEPFTRTTNAINDHPILVHPGKTWVTTLEFSIKNQTPDFSEV
jgi:galactose mutarotase-like enzyme